MLPAAQMMVYNEEQRNVSLSLTVVFTDITLAKLAVPCLHRTCAAASLSFFTLSLNYFLPERTAAGFTALKLSLEINHC